MSRESDREALSRLLDGDLSEPEATALRERIAAEPELQRAWEATTELGELLGALEEAPPTGLDARVLREGTPDTAPREHGSRAASAVPWLVAALALLALGWWTLASPEAIVRLVHGSQVIEGRVNVLAGTVPVAIDGIARISVEPAGGPFREWGQQEDEMKTAMLSALAGAAVTVAVYEGTARIGGDAGDVVVVEAGQTHPIPPEERRVRREGPARRVTLPEDASPAAIIEALEAENTRLAEQLQAMRFEGAVVKGQLAAHQGEPAEWPAEVPEGYEPDAFEQNLRGLLAAHPDIAIDAIDCAEFPCIAMLTSPAGDEGWQDRLQELPKSFADQHLGDGTNLQIMMGASDDGDVRTGAVGFAAYPGDSGREGELERRSDYRMQSLLEAAMGE